MKRKLKEAIEILKEELKVWTPVEDHEIRLYEAYETIIEELEE